MLVQFMVSCPSCFFQFKLFSMFGFRFPFRGIFPWLTFFPAVTDKGRGHKRNADTYDKPLPDGVLAGSLASVTDRFFPVVQVQTTY